MRSVRITEPMGSGRALRQLLVGALLTGAMSLTLGAGASAQAAVQFRATVTPESFSHRTPVLTYRLEMVTGDREERFQLAITRPQYARKRDGEPVGSPLDELRRAPDEGPGRIVYEGAIASFPDGVCIKGGTSHTAGAFLTLPPNTKTVIGLRYRPLQPWGDIDYRLMFRAKGGTLQMPQTIRSANPRLRGRRGLRIELNTSPRTTAGGRRLKKAVRRLHVRGKTSSQLAGRLITLRYATAESYGGLTYGRPRLRTLSRVRVSKRGTFSYSWLLPTRSAAYELFAVYRGTKRFLRSESCSRRFHRGTLSIVS